MREGRGRQWILKCLVPMAVLVVLVLRVRFRVSIYIVRVRIHWELSKMIPG